MTEDQTEYRDDKEVFTKNVYNKLDCKEYINLFSLTREVFN